MGHALRIVPSDGGPTAPQEGARLSVLLMATIETGACRLDVRLREISGYGAVIEAPLAPPLGSYVTFSRGSIRTVAQIIWAKDGKLGLSFRDEIDEAELLINVGVQQLPPPPLKALFPH